MIYNSQAHVCSDCNTVCRFIYFCGVSCDRFKGNEMYTLSLTWLQSKLNIKGI